MSYALRMYGMRGIYGAKREGTLERLLLPGMRSCVHCVYGLRG